MTVKRRQGRPPMIENAHDRILNEASILFGRQGYENSSISDVANSIGVSKAAIFHYFPTKQAIYDAIIVRTLRGLHETVTAAVEREEPGLSRLHRFMIAHATYFEENFWGFVTMLVGYGGMASPTLKDEALKLRDHYETFLRGIIAEGIAAGELKEVDVASTGRAVLSLLNWMVRWFKPGQGSAAAEVAETYYRLIVSGLTNTIQENPHVPR